MGDMTELKYVAGDATQPPVEEPVIIAHVCNDIGGWGRGFVVALSNKWPEPEDRYRSWFAGREVADIEERSSERPALGEVQFVAVTDPRGGDIKVANMIGQHDIRWKHGKPPVRYEAIRAALRKVAEKATAEGRHVVMPKIGAGLAGGDWETIANIIEEELCGQGVETAVYLLA